MTGLLTERPAWRALVAHHEKSGRVHLRELFVADAKRGERFALEAAGLYFDYSKNRITKETLTLLTAFADECSLRERNAAMFRGEAINTTEKRSVLHIALRAPATQKITLGGVDVIPEIHAVLNRMAVFAEALP